MDKIRGVISDALSNNSDMQTKILYFFLFLIIIYVVIRIIFYILAYYDTIKGNTITILNSKISGSERMSISQNPNEVNYKQIIRSKNKKGGLEFSYSLWMNIDPTQFIGVAKYNIHDCLIYDGLNKVNYDENCSPATITNNNLIHIFSKGNVLGESTNINTADGNVFQNVKKENNAPGLYLATNVSNELNKNSVSLILFMDTTSNPGYKDKAPIVMTNIPTKKWLNVCIVAKQPSIFVYVNGILKAKKTVENEVFKQNYDNIMINDNSSPIYWGELSTIKYYDKALSSFEISNIVKKRPSVISKNDNKSNVFPDYLNFDYYL